jgi:hypothetical protein
VIKSPTWYPIPDVLTVALRTSPFVIDDTIIDEDVFPDIDISRVSPI